MILYHVSKDPHISETVVYPRIPTYRMEGEDQLIPRICVSPSILGCLSAVDQLEVGDAVYIYTCESNNIFQPSCQQVADQHLTGEVWITEAVKIEYFQEIIIKEKIIREVDGCVIPYYIYEVK